MPIRLTLGATSRILDKPARANSRQPGQIFYFSDPRCWQLLPAGGRGHPTDPTQSLPALRGRVFHVIKNECGAWRFRSDVIWNPYNNAKMQGSAIFNYQPEPRKNHQRGIGFRNNLKIPTMPVGRRSVRKCQMTALTNPICQTIWPINNQVELIARWQHDFVATKPLKHSAGLGIMTAAA